MEVRIMNVNLGNIRGILVAVLCLVTTSSFGAAWALGGHAATITGDEHFTLNGYADIFKLNGGGAPVDPRYGQSNERSQYCDFGYDEARDIARLITLITGIASLGLTAWKHRKDRSTKSNWERLLQATFVAIGITTAVHIFCTFCINDFGALGGSL
jgi:hypothetical protein